MNEIKKAWDDYLKLGTNTRLIIRITLILFFSLCFAVIYTYNATHSSNHYELLLLCDMLFESTKSVSGIGFLGIVITGLVEKTTQHEN